MALQKVSYVSKETVIGAENLNNIQDAIIELEKNQETGAVGIQSIAQTTTSAADGGTNVVTITLTDGTKKTFSVKNGTKGSPGEGGTDGVGVCSIEQTVVSTEDGGANTIVVTLTDGTQASFVVRNGTKGNAGEMTDEQMAEILADYLGRNPIGEYTLPVATSTRLGGVMPVTKLSVMTTPVGVDSSGRLYVDTYEKSDIDAALGNYITDIAALVGGDA